MGAGGLLPAWVFRALLPGDGCLQRPRPGHKGREASLDPQRPKCPLWGPSAFRVLPVSLLPLWMCRVFLYLCRAFAALSGVSAYPLPRGDIVDIPGF